MWLFILFWIIAALLSLSAIIALVYSIRRKDFTRFTQGKNQMFDIHEPEGENQDW